MENFLSCDFFFHSDYLTGHIDKFELDGKRKTKRKKKVNNNKKNNNNNDQLKLFAHHLSVSDTIMDDAEHFTGSL